MRTDPDKEPRRQKVTRRLKTIPLIVVSFVVVTALLPLLMLGALVVDVFRAVTARKPFMALRLVAFLWIYLATDTLALLTLFVLWLLGGFGHNEQRMVNSAWHFQQLWVKTLLGSVKLLFGLRIVDEGAECLRPGPVIVLIRHASIVDNLLPSALVAARERIRLRYVLKRELLSEPCLDIAGQRLPNYFVRRDTGEEVERERIGQLARDMGSDDGFLLYPEGTRFTAERRQRALEKIAERDPQRAARLEPIEYLLPPKVGGLLAVLDQSPNTDVVLMIHQGFDGLRLISDIWGGALVGRVINVRFTRVPHDQIPASRDDQVAWLDELWLEADRWVASKTNAA
ncbi:MAG: lysophospholipid acyltransferase family protein [Solirubrobacteraceae bacterium]|nr:lysophospholipid acyltransferase family protein [Solirubrobacteraceae bacterium]MDP4673379.1 lysophospholipid acyltransferase family protein [Solirubrobacteraceae bacterium]MDP4921711.1 lysophospholipid acyltransferase family protein [Solirubrobacteraceae bacterium]